MNKEIENKLEEIERAITEQKSEAYKSYEKIKDERKDKEHSERLKRYISIMEDQKIEIFYLQKQVELLKEIIPGNRHVLIRENLEGKW